MDSEIHKLGLKLKFAYSMGGLFLGFISIVVGGLLTLAGAFGNTSLVASMFGMEASLSDAPPGVFLFLVGLFMIGATRFSVKHEYNTSEAANVREPAHIPSTPVQTLSSAQVALPVQQQQSAATVPPGTGAIAPRPKGRTGKSSKNLTMRETSPLAKITNERLSYKRPDGETYYQKGPGKAAPKAAARAAKPAAKAGRASKAAAKK